MLYFSNSAQSQVRPISRGLCLRLTSPSPFYRNICTDWQIFYIKKLPKFWPKSRLTMLTRSKHSTDVSVSFVKALLDDSVDEGRAMEQHSLVALKSNLFCIVKFQLFSKGTLNTIGVTLFLDRKQSKCKQINFIYKTVLLIFGVLNMNNKSVVPLPYIYVLKSKIINRQFRYSS